MFDCATVFIQSLEFTFNSLFLKATTITYIEYAQMAECLQVLKGNIVRTQLFSCKDFIIGKWEKF